MIERFLDCQPRKHDGENTIGSTKVVLSNPIHDLLGLSWAQVGSWSLPRSDPRCRKIVLTAAGDPPQCETAVPCLWEHTTSDILARVLPIRNHLYNVTK